MSSFSWLKFLLSVVWLMVWYHLLAKGKGMTSSSVMPFHCYFLVNSHLLYVSNQCAVCGVMQLAMETIHTPWLCSESCCHIRAGEEIRDIVGKNTLKNTVNGVWMQSKITFFRWVPIYMIIWLTKLLENIPDCIHWGSQKQEEWGVVCGRCELLLQKKNYG